MIYKNLIYICICVSFMSGAYVLNKAFTHKPIESIDKMPLVQNEKYAYLAKGFLPIEERSAKYNKWLACGVKIMVTDATGSGTIIYYNKSDGYAYIQSCGHLWSGNMTAEEGKSRKIKCRIMTWYHNEEKLSSPKTYPADVLYYSNSRGRDCSLLRFKPDWDAKYLPIGPEDFKFYKNTVFHSVGCDSGKEVAHYDVKYVGMSDGQWPDFVTVDNSPRPGRSGGGLSSEDFYIGICWGTSDFYGGGNGFFTPLKTIREYNRMNGFGWLNEVGHSLAREIPIIDKNNPQENYPKDYIPLPLDK